MATDIRDARFYLMQDGLGSDIGEATPQTFDEAFGKAKMLVKNGAAIRVLYTGEASQTQITRFLSHGIPATCVK